MSAHIIPTFEDALLNPLDYEVKVGWICTLTHVDDDTIGAFITHAQGSQIIQAMSNTMELMRQRQEEADALEQSIHQSLERAYGPAE